METVIIPRCLKRPGLIERAKTYRLQWNNQGLYLICLGNATLQVNTQQSAAHALASGIVDKMAAKFEQQAQATEKRIEQEGLPAMAQTKKSYFIPTADLQVFEYKPVADGSLRVNIKSKVVNMALQVHTYYQPQLDAILRGIK